MVHVTADDPDSDEARALIAELGAALARMTGDSGAASFDPADVRGVRAGFVLARGPDGMALGCGALRPLEGDIAELKRMYARPGTGAGVGAALLAHLERQAVELGYVAVWLETRRINTRAVAFYDKHGYRPIANYGKYVGRLDAICMGKSLRAI
jgi:ribosomal protein S18 acetylase RimI-like enzyme